jgi:hypothetical protein
LLPHLLSAAAAATGAAGTGDIGGFPVQVHAVNLTAYRWVLLAHSAWRWVVLVAGVTAVVNPMLRLSSGQPWAPIGPRVGRFFSISVDIQVLMGAALYLVLSPITTIVAQTAVMRLPHNSQAFFFIVQHPSMMIAAFIAVHIASVVARRGASDAARQRRALIGYGITLLIILGGIPWFRPLLRF